MGNEVNTHENIKDNVRFTNEMSILDVVVLMIKNWWVIALAGLVFALVCYAYSKSVSIPAYVSTGSLYIDTQREQITDDVNAASLMQAADLMPTYIEILKSRNFNQILSDAMDGKYSSSQMDSMVKLAQIGDTNIMEITVTCRDKDDSYLLCKRVIELADDEILRVFEGGAIKPIDEPKKEPTVSVINLFQRGIVGFLVGAVLATAVIVLFSIFDTRITNSDELTAKYKIPILGEIPNLNESI